VNPKEEGRMALIDTKDMMKTGQFKTYSYYQMLWLTKIKGCRVASMLHVPKRNFLGRLSTSKVWIIDPNVGKHR
jgi:hypothetical protein